METDISLVIYNKIDPTFGETMWERHETVGDLLKVACEIWRLPNDRQYVLFNPNTRKILAVEEDFRHPRYRDGQRLYLKLAPEQSAKPKPI